MATTASQYDFFVTLEDLMFILNQIKIAEQTTDPNGTLDGEALRDAVNPLAPFGLRTVDGSWNNLLPGQELYGSADMIMPRLTSGTLLPEYTTPYYPGTTLYMDADPRIISNLISDQTATNPAAVIAADDRADESTFPGLETVQVSENGTLFIPNQSPDIGLSPPFNGVMTLFGQFFDHGLDLITKGGGTVFVPLQPDDPLYVEGSNTNFMVLTRATTGDVGPDGVAGTADDGHINTTTSFVDQNQTYTSHPSHQVFLREYTLDASGLPVATGHLLEGQYGPANWTEVKAQAAELLGVQLTDADVFNVPLLATDEYGEFIRSPSGYVQFVTASGLVPADPMANGGLGTLVPEDAFRTNHAFLDDIAHNAAPSLVDHDHNPATARIAQTADVDVDLNGDGVISDAERLADDGDALTYDDDLLGRHFITGDGRGNENIGLTAIHTVFHAEHNRLVDQYKETLIADAIARQDVTFLNEWLTTGVSTAERTPEQWAALAAEVAATAQWNGERLFQAGRFVTEMEYQHMVFEEFARTVSPSIDPFVFQNSADLDPAIFEEFANVVYRFGHSMLTETVDRTDAATMTDYDIGLIQAFLNPVEFNLGGVDAEGNPIALDVGSAIAGIMLGMSTQVGNEIDEFVTEALRNNLLGLPLDLATINITRARETAMPTFNEARQQFYEMTGDSQYSPYTSWVDLAPHLKNPASVVNFIAAYGDHATITAATTLEEKRDAANMLVFGRADLNNDGDTADAGETAAPTDRLAFLNGTGQYAQAGEGTGGGVDNIDFWIGGLAEAKLEFGGMLGPTFNFVFETQLENLQNGDRFYYLSRTQGLNLLNELEANTFSTMVMRNSDLGNDGVTAHLPSLLFTTPSYVLEMDQANQRTGIVGPDGVTMNGDPTRGDFILDLLSPLVQRANAADGYDARLDKDGDGVMEYSGLLSYAYDGGDHVVLGGTSGNDILLGGRGMDSIWGDAGNDYIDAGDESDQVHGGDGDDIIVDHGTVAGGADFLRGDNGNDVIGGGPGNDLLFGGEGKDFIFTGQDFSEVFAGRGDDFVMGGNGPDVLMGNEGNDWVEGGEGFDSLSGDNSELFFNSPIIGHDVLNGMGNDSDYDGESGDDIMVQGPGIQRSNGMFGFDWAIHQGDTVGANSDLGIPIFVTQPDFILRDRFDSVEGLSGWEHNDVLTGAIVLHGGAGGAGDGVEAPLDASNLKAGNVGLIDGLAELLGTTEAELALLAPDTTVLDITEGAEIIIGGGGSDTITGNLGNDIIDGDAWLGVHIAVDMPEGGEPDFTVNSMEEIRDRMLTREINPAQLSIVREIQFDSAAGDIDTAVYNGSFEEYTVTTENGITTVSHTAQAATTLTNDGTDTLRNIEQLQFLDRLVQLGLAIAGGEQVSLSIAENTQAVTTLSLTNSDPTQLYLFSLEGADAALFEIDALVGTLSFVTAPNFEAAADAGLDNVYDVVVRVTDGVLSDTQALSVTVTNADDAATGTVDITSWTTTATTASLTATSTVVDEDVATIAPEYQWQRLEGETWVDMTGEEAATVANLSNVTTRVVATYTDAFGQHQVVSTQTAVIGDGLNNTLTGTAGADILLGLGGADALTGGAGNDVLEGNDGNDTLFASVGDGNDSLAGGLGIDTYNLAATGAAAAVNLTTNTSTSGETGSDALADIENVVGSQGGDTITDGAGSNVLTGGAGADTFVMTNDGARDTVNGAGGSNTISYAANTIGISVTLNEATAVQVLGTGTAGTTTDMISNIDNVIGGSGNDSITGDGSANTLTGNGGADTLNGGAGADVLDGGLGADSLTGGAGADVVDGGAGNDTLVASVNDGSDTLIGGDGTDLYNLSATSAAATVNLTTNTSTSTQTGSDTLAGIENVTGSSGGDTITDGAGSNVLTGGAGADTFVMTADNAQDTINGLGGRNTVDYSSATTSLNVTLTNGAVVGGSGTTAATSDIITNINNFTGGSASDSITGNNNGNVLLGGGGNDTLMGGGGVDNMQGGTGDDMLMASGGNDTIDGGAGTDTYNLSATTASATVNLATGTSSSTQTGSDTLAGVENVIGSQAGDNITGDGLANSLVGNGGADTLNGGAGNDTLDGGAGNDTLLGGTGNDTLLGGADNDNLQGQDGNDSLNGGAGIDTLTGGLGTDVSTGGTGSDVFDFNSTAEAPVTATAATRETVTDFTSGIDDLDLSGVDANEMPGATGDNSFVILGPGSTFSTTNELRYQQQGADLLLQANVNNPSPTQPSIPLNQPDMQIQLTGMSTLPQADVIM